VRRNLRVAAAVLGVLCIAIWFALGANRGWTRTTRTRMEKDPTADNMDVAVVEKYFSPGVEVLVAGLFVSAALASFSFVFKTKPKH